MNKFISMASTLAQLDAILAARRAFTQFVAQHHDPFVRTLLTCIATGQSSLDSLAREIGYEKDTLVLKLVELRAAISKDACLDDSGNCSDHDWVLDNPAKGINTFGDLAFFLDCIPEVSIAIPEAVIDSELELLELRADTKTLEHLISDARSHIMNGTAESQVGSRFSDQFRLAAAPVDKEATVPSVARDLRHQESLGSVRGERGRCIFSQLDHDVYTLFDSGDCPTLLELIGVKPSSFTLLPSDTLPGLFKAEGLTVEIVRQIVKKSKTNRNRVLARWS